MKIIMLGAPVPAKELRQRRFQISLPFHTFQQEIFSVPILKMIQSLERKPKHIWIRDC